MMRDENNIRKKPGDDMAAHNKGAEGMKKQ